MPAPVASETRSPVSEISACSAGGPSPGGYQSRAELVAVERGGMRLVVHPRATDVRGG
jgi:hypothetical protein